MAVKDLKASFRLDLTGNLFGKSQQLANRLSRMGQTGQPQYDDVFKVFNSG